MFIPIHSSFSLFRPVQGLESSNIKRVIVSPFDSKSICVTSDNSLYKSQDGGEEFNKVAVFKDEEVKHIFFDSFLADTVYIATSRHLYRLKERLEKLFTSSGEELIFTALKHKGLLYVGTGQGLFVASEDALIWRKVKAFSGFAIYFLESSEDKVYLATQKGVYLLKEDDRIERLFVMREEEAIGEEGLVSNVIRVDIFNKDYLWLGTNHGLFISEDQGINWRKLYISGIDNLFINCLTQTKLQTDIIYLSTTKGFFMVDLKQNKSKQLFEGLNSSYISWAEFTAEGRIYLATSKGLFENDYFFSSYSKNDLEVVLEGEPLIGEVQEAVLAYNEVSPDKIRKWREDAARRAWLPKLDVGMDAGIDEQYHWAGTSVSSYYLVSQGPNDRSLGWDISLEWDLADLIWNPSQASSIDTRSKLNTQLRLDILDEINRVYFERIRLKRELSQDNLTEEDLFKKQLRLLELTAIIDGYTGGYLSKRIGERNAR
ncbi:MAG: hypothetical protein P9M02_03620 [Candidatus Susulua stagnicola]|nr:hypothetical protein [Candidatus Susulua stagnicola]